MKTLLTAGVAMWVIGSAALAQDGKHASPLEGATAAKSEQPATIAPKPPEPVIQKLVSMLTGSFEAPAAGNSPALRFNSSAITVDGLDNAVYFEIGRADSPANPFRQGVLHAYRMKDQLRLRVFDFLGAPGLRDTMVGMWAAPDALPALKLENLDPNLDMVLTPGEKSGTYSGATPHPYPTCREGAVELTQSCTINDGELGFADMGIAADGQTVWGGSVSQTMFKRATPTVTAKRMEGGLIVLTLVAPAADATKLGENGEVAVQYSGWLTDGTRFDSSRQPGRDAFKLRVPGPVIKGWNEGLKSIAKGERRRLVIPPTLGYGERGARGAIPPNATLIFDVECVYVDNTPPPTAATPPAVPAAAPASTPGSSKPPTPTPPAPTAPTPAAKPAETKP